MACSTQQEMECSAVDVINSKDTGPLSGRLLFVDQVAWYARVKLPLDRSHERAPEGAEIDSAPIDFDSLALQLRHGAVPDVSHLSGLSRLPR